jgi:hypothetical protein
MAARTCREDVLSAPMERAERTACGRGVTHRHFALYARTGLSSGVIETPGHDNRVVLDTPDSVLGEVRPVIERTE